MLWELITLGNYLDIFLFFVRNFSIIVQWVSVLLESWKFSCSGFLWIYTFEMCLKCIDCFWPDACELYKFCSWSNSRSNARNSTRLHINLDLEKICWLDFGVCRPNRSVQCFLTICVVDKFWNLWDRFVSNSICVMLIIYKKNMIIKCMVWSLKTELRWYAVLLAITA